MKAQDLYPPAVHSCDMVLAQADTLRRGLSVNFRDELVEAIYDDAERIARRAVTRVGKVRLDLDQKLDQLLTSRILGLPIMVGLLAAVFWLTIAGANVSVPTHVI